MFYLKIKSMKKLIALFSLIITFSFSLQLQAKDYKINGNKFSDDEVIISILDKIPNSDDKTNSNFILKELNNSGLFKSVSVEYDDKFYYINVVEFPSINKIYYSNNERIKDDEINDIVQELEIFTLSDNDISILTEELKNIYKSFGYNNIQIDVNSDLLDNNSANLYLDFIEGNLTKIKKINFTGNNNIDDSILISKIKSKTKKLSNIFANNNFKLYQLNNDIIRLRNFYQSQGYKDIYVDFKIEYFKNNKVEVNFTIKEGNKYFFSSFKIKNNLQKNKNLQNNLDTFIFENETLKNTKYDKNKLDELEINILEILENSGEQFFKIETYEKITDNNADILFQISKTDTTYVNQINISGNTRTYDYVIRRELDISEGDSINNSKLKRIKRQLSQLPFFGDIEVEQITLNKNYQDLNILVEERQTGSFNVGLSVGTLDGASFVSGLKERNINGTGRSLEFLINTNESNRAFTLSTTEKFILNPKVNHKYSAIYRENNYAKAKSYKLNTFSLDTSFKYILSEDIYHTIGLGYSIKDYIITNNSTVSKNVENSSGENINFNFNNEITLNSLNSFIRPTKGIYISFENFLETPSSSSNGFIKNIITAKKFIENNDNIYSAQTRIGNVYALNNNEILSDNKFSLGGRWLRGFDNFGAGPRNSRTAYVGGNNLVVTKFDFSRPITSNQQNPIYFNLFNDSGLVWGNKNAVSSSTH